MATSVSAAWDLVKDRESSSASERLDESDYEIEFADGTTQVYRKVTTLFTFDGTYANAECASVVEVLECTLPLHAMSVIIACRLLIVGSYLSCDYAGSNRHSIFLLLLTYRFRKRSSNQTQ